MYVYIYIYIYIGVSLGHVPTKAAGGAAFQWP